MLKLVEKENLLQNRFKIAKGKLKNQSTNDLINRLISSNAFLLECTVFLDVKLPGRSHLLVLGLLLQTLPDLFLLLIY